MYIKKVLDTIEKFSVVKYSEFSNLDKLTVQKITIPSDRIKQDEFGEAFFPIVSTDSDESRLTFKFTYESNVNTLDIVIARRSEINISHNSMGAEEEVIEKYIKELNNRLSKDAVDAMFLLANNLKIITKNGTSTVPDNSFKGITGELLNYHYDSLTFDMKDIQANENFKKEVVKALKVVISSAYMLSRYGVVFAKLHPDAKPTVLIGCSPELKAMLSSVDWFESGYEFDVKFAATTNSKMKDKLFIIFILNNKELAEDIDPLESGVCGCSTNTTIVTGGNESICIPEYIHIPLLPILIEINITR